VTWEREEKDKSKEKDMKMKQKVLETTNLPTSLTLFKMSFALQPAFAST
jgi:hypothetical protein